MAERRQEGRKKVFKAGTISFRGAAIDSQSIEPRVNILHTGLLKIDFGPLAKAGATH
jgi:hypothetical protein